MTKEAPLDLVARAAAKMEVEGWSPKAPENTPDVTPPVAPAAAASVENTPAPPAAGGGQRGVGGQFEIDFVDLQKDGFLTPDVQNSRISEEFRLIKRPLLRIAFDSRETDAGLGHVIMVASARPDDGKTFVTANLAMSLASERDLFVLAIDADIRRKGLSNRFGVTDRPGIMDVLLNPNISISDVMLRTNVSNLAVIPAGGGMDGATELFASQRMTKLVQDIASRYKDRIIIFDTPPVLAASEAGVLASHVGQIAFVVTSGETTKRSIAESLRLIDVCPHVHFIVNRMMHTTNDHFGYYDY